jgi:DnaJ-class molecular chaperone
MNLKPEDLHNLCKTCNGSGTISVNPSSGSALGVLASTESEPCMDCQGLGYKITETGRAIQAFLRFLKQKGQL